MIFGNSIIAGLVVDQVFGLPKSYRQNDFSIKFYF